MNFIEVQIADGSVIDDRRTALVNLDHVETIVKHDRTGNANICGRDWLIETSEPYGEIAIRIKEKENSFVKNFMHHFKRIMYEVRR